MTKPKHQLMLEQAKVGVIRHSAFFASILMTRVVKFDNRIPRAAVDMRGTIMLNSEWVVTQTVPKLIGTLIHECWHVMKLDFLRSGMRNHMGWNIASDQWINATVKGDGLELPDDHVNWDEGDARTHTTEWLYDQVMDKAQKEFEKLKEQLQNGGPGMDLPDGSEGQGQGIDVDSAEGREIAAQIKMDVAQAVHAAQTQGKLTGALREFADQLLAQKVPWHKILEQYMIKFVKTPRRTWKKPNRRYASLGIYMPSRKKEPQMGHAVVQLDVSGSITAESMAKYVSQVENILNDAKPKKVTILWTDTEIKHKQTIEWPDVAKVDNFMSAGGTDMEHGMRVMEDDEDPVDVFICISDGYTPYTSAPSFPVIWVLDNEVSQPTYGDVIRIN
jgi:predicted metal-dependent peptidase